MPEILHGLDLGKEAVASYVEAPAIALDSPADPSDHVVCFEHQHGTRGLGQLVCSRQPGRPRADDDDGDLVRLCCRSHQCQNSQSVAGPPRADPAVRARKAPGTILGPGGHRARALPLVTCRQPCPAYPGGGYRFPAPCPRTLAAPRERKGP